MAATKEGVWLLMPIAEEVSAGTEPATAGSSSAPSGGTDNKDAKKAETSSVAKNAKDVKKAEISVAENANDVKTEKTNAATDEQGSDKQTNGDTPGKVPLPDSLSGKVSATNGDAPGSLPDDDTASDDDGDARSLLTELKQERTSDALREVLRVRQEIRESLQMFQDQLDNVMEEIVEVRRRDRVNASGIGYMMGWDVWLREMWNSRARLRPLMHVSDLPELVSAPSPSSSSAPSPSSSGVWNMA
jgi:hypothetical protein